MISIDIYNWTKKKKKKKEIAKHIAKNIYIYKNILSRQGEDERRLLMVLDPKKYLKYL